MTNWTDVSDEPLGRVLDDAVNTRLNTIGAKAGLAPLLWNLSPMQLTMPSNQPDELTTPNILVTGNVREIGFPHAPADYDMAETAHAWARLLNLALATGGPVGQLIFAGHHETIIVRVLAIVDPDAFRQDTERREAEWQRHIDEVVKNMETPQRGREPW